MKKSAALMVFAAAAGLVACGPSAPKANLTSDIDSLSYTMGVGNTQGLMNYATARLGVDSVYKANFIEGIVDGTANISSKEKAHFAGVQIGQQISGDMFNAINNQIFGNDTINALSKDKFITGFIQGVEGKNKTSLEEAAQYVQLTVSDIQRDSVRANITNKVDSLSLMMGISNTQGLMNYATSRLGVDSAYVADFSKGIVEGTKVIDAKEKAHMAGMQIGMQISGDMFDAMNNQLFAGNKEQSLSKENFLAGFIEGINGTNTISVEDAIQYVTTKSEAIKTKALEAKYGEYKKENEQFLIDNKNKEGIKTTESGLQYRIVKAGNGEIPTKESRVKVHYKGTLIDGTKFDSSYDRNEPTTFLANQVIPGWTEALTLMPVGSKWELYIPQELAYGSRDMGEIKPFSTLIFEVELLSIEK